MQQNFLNGMNQTYLLDLYHQYLNAPSNVSEEWRDFFSSVEETPELFAKDRNGASWAPRESNVIGNATKEPLSDDLFDGNAQQKDNGFDPNLLFQQFTSQSFNNNNNREGIINSIRAVRMIRAYRLRGHSAADLDPLNLNAKKNHPELDYHYYGFTDNDLNKTIYLNFVMGIEHITLQELIEFCKKTYCGSLGIEYMHIQIPEEVKWLQERIETPTELGNFTPTGKKAILERLTASEGFERFLDRKYPGTKRFGLDGGETTIPLMEQIIKRSSKHDVSMIAIGMSHRGRLNVLAHIMQKPYRALLSEFQGHSATPDGVQGSGDVKYHLGHSADREFDGKTVHLSLASNPSHLEAVNTVVLGKVKAYQKTAKDKRHVLGILVHGDAAFAGQGIVAETLLSSQLEGYETYGTIHVIVNNQIGFTTMPSMARSSPYCSDVAQASGAPILHVNGDDPEASMFAARIAVEYRQTFGKDVVIDLWCYRRHGHSEIEEPMFTQPIMYRKISEQKSTRETYAARLIAENTLTQNDVDAMNNSLHDRLEVAFNEANSYKPNKADWLEGVWHGIKGGLDNKIPKTGVTDTIIKQIAAALSHVPKNFNINHKLTRFVDARKKMFETGEGVDWATGEAMAFGSLLCESSPVRLSGEDCQRGTFSQRHAVLIDQESEEPYVQLNNIRFGQANIEIFNSPLSEYGVLGFEYGYAMTAPSSLTIWEAQFGDFANGAQVIFDQFISSSESKWLRLSGLVMLLPHGYDGQGPEHSSARLERYLQLCAEDNMRVCNITTPANYFHALRLQLHSPTRKPLLIMSPKALLRHKKCVSSLADFADDTQFQPVLADDRDKKLKADKIKRLVLCSGKIYYELLEAMERDKNDDIYLLRVERLHPYPEVELLPFLKKFKNAELIWCQEEPENMGSWHYIDRKLEGTMKNAQMKASRPVYIGRPAAASPATGIAKKHALEQAQLVKDIQTMSKS